MPSFPRYAILYDHCTFHVTWQCHNKDWLLQSSQSKALYMALIKKYAPRYKVHLYNFCLMSNHPHLSGCCENARLLSDFFRTINSTFARSFNRDHQRRGQVVMDRFKSPVMETDTDLLNVMLYIDMNPVRAKMVKHPRQYHWSSHKFYANGKFPSWMEVAPSYLKLGKTRKQRAKAYCRLVAKRMENPGEKRNYSTVNFIGSENWVMLKARQLREENRKRRLVWLDSYKLKFGSMAPPGPSPHP